MELSKCLRCERIFGQVKLPVCSTCEAEEDKEMLEVSRYLRDHPNSSLDEVSDALNIYLEDIFRWISEKRLEVEVRGRVNLECESCGAPIVSGRMCIGCRSKLFESPSEGIKTETRGAQAGGSVVVGSSSFRDRGGAGKYRRA